MMGMILPILGAAQEGSVGLEWILIREVDTRTDQHALIIEECIGHRNEDLHRIDGTAEFHPILGRVQYIRVGCGCCRRR